MNRDWQMKTGDSGVAPAQGSGRMASGTQHDFNAEPIVCVLGGTVGSQ